MDTLAPLMKYVPVILSFVKTSKTFANLELVMLFGLGISEFFLDLSFLSLNIPFLSVDDKFQLIPPFFPVKDSNARFSIRFSLTFLCFAYINIIPRGPKVETLNIAPIFFFLRSYNFYSRYKTLLLFSYG